MDSTGWPVKADNSDRWRQTAQDFQDSALSSGGGPSSTYSMFHNILVSNEAHKSEMYEKVASKVYSW